jgi:hypothetical protein
VIFLYYLNRFLIFLSNRENFIFCLNYYLVIIWFHTYDLLVKLVDFYLFLNSQIISIYNFIRNIKNIIINYFCLLYMTLEIKYYFLILRSNYFTIRIKDLKFILILVSQDRSIINKKLNIFQIKI